MKNLVATIAFFFIISHLFSQNKNANIVTSDIDNFWVAYDKITATKDSAEQYKLLNKFFLNKGTPGLKLMMQARRYTAESYINAINNHPLFWQSVRKNMGKAASFAKEIEANVQKIKSIYPDLKPAKTYFTVGAFNSSGTVLNGTVLIGSELAFADKNAVMTEFSPQYSYLRSYFDGNPIEGIVFLNTHEYVHTQQKTTIGNNLLAQTVIEGAAEFVAVKATGIVSTTPAIEFGKKNEPLIKERFATDMFGDDFDDWLWNSFDNRFKMRDLAYYVGYAICEKYYEAATDKQRAIKEMIELNYNNKADLIQFVDKSGYLQKPMKAYLIAPKVVSIQPFNNGDNYVNPSIKQIRIEFSDKMNTNFTSFDFGPLGEKNALRVNKFFGFARDGKSAIIDVDLKPNQHYQLVVSQGFRSINGERLEPYLIDFETGENYAPDDKKLYETIVQLDSLFFESYNTCDKNLEKHAAFYSDNLEFYHDKGGLMTSKTDVINGIKNNVCGKVKRELIKGSIEVYPINNYGAIEIGLHKFHNNTEPEDTPSHAGKFMLIWEFKDNKWLVKRVVSLH